MQKGCDLSIITINYNGVEDTCELIDSIPKEDFSIEVIVVDNASVRDEASEIERRFPHITTIRSDENLGFAGGNNIGYKHSHGRYILFINNDTVFGSSKIKPMMERMESNAKIGVICPKLVFFDSPHSIQYAGYTPLSRITLRNRAIGCGEQDNGQYNEARQTPYAHGAAMLVRREAIEKAGLMPECYFLYYEELDWSISIRRSGYEIWYEPLTTIYHKESRTTGQHSPLRAYYIARNRLLFSQRNVGAANKWASYTYITLAIMAKDVLGNVLQGHTQLAAASIEGIWDFLTGRTNKKK